MPDLTHYQRMLATLMDTGGIPDTLNCEGFINYLAISRHVRRQKED